MGDPGVGPLGRSGRMERVAEQDEPGVRGVGLGGGEARHATTEGVATDGDVRLGSGPRGGRQAGRPRPCAWAGRWPWRPRRAPADRRRTGPCWPPCRSRRVPGSTRMPMPYRVAGTARPGYIGHGPVGSWPGRRPTRPSSGLPAPEGPMPLTVHDAAAPRLTDRRSPSRSSSAARRARSGASVAGPRDGARRGPAARRPSPTAEPDSDCPRPTPAPTDPGRPSSARPSRSTAAATATASACPSTAPAAGRSPARTPRRSSPTTTAARPSGRSRPRPASGSGSCRLAATSTDAPLVDLRPRGAVDDRRHRRDVPGRRGPPASPRRRP